MADKKISQLTTLAQADVAPTADFLPIVDTGSSETKKVTPQALVLAAVTNQTVELADGSAGTPSLTNDGDENTGLFFPAADTVAVSTGGTERARIDSSGNLGIGTASPAYPLQVRRAGGGGSLGISIDSVGSTDRTVQYFAIQDNASGVGAGHAFYYRGPSSTTDTIGVLLDESGNLGIGTASPAARLQVKSSLAQAVNIEGTTARGSGNIYAAFLDPTGRKGYVGYASGADDTFFVTNEMNAEILFQTNGQNRMRIDANGNVQAGNQAALATTATDGFLYVPTCQGTPTGTPTAITGMAPIVVDTTNNKMYFYSGGAWRDAGP